MCCISTRYGLNFYHRLQEFVSYRRLLPERISGLTYEPHWFAEQIIVLLLPGLLACGAERLHRLSTNVGAG